jgi:hypothetical protein
VVDDSKLRLQRSSIIGDSMPAAGLPSAAVMGQPLLLEPGVPASTRALQAGKLPNGMSQLAGRDATAAILYPDVAAFAAAGISSSADCYAQLPADQQQQHKARSEFGGSMVTDATWLTEAGQSCAASVLSPTLTGLSSKGWESRIDSCAWGSEFETVFHMTGAA